MRHRNRVAFLRHERLARDDLFRLIVEPEHMQNLPRPNNLRQNLDNHVPGIDQRALHAIRVIRTPEVALPLQRLNRAPAALFRVRLPE